MSLGRRCRCGTSWCGVFVVSGRRAVGGVRRLPTLRPMRTQCGVHCLFCVGPPTHNCNSTQALPLLPVQQTLPVPSGAFSTCPTSGL